MKVHVNINATSLDSISPIILIIEKLIILQTTPTKAYEEKLFDQTICVSVSESESGLAYLSPGSYTVPHHSKEIGTLHLIKTLFLSYGAIISALSI